MIAALNENDPETLKLRAPVQIEQGTADTTVLPLFTDQLVPKLKANGVDRDLQDLSKALDHAGAVVMNAKAGRGRDELREGSGWARAAGRRWATALM